MICTQVISIQRAVFSLPNENPIIFIMFMIISIFSNNRAHNNNARITEDLKSKK